MDNNTIEEIVVEGAIGHFDCALVANCPNLRKSYSEILCRVQEARDLLITVRNWTA